MITSIENFDIMKMNIHDPYDISDHIIKMDISVDKMKPIMLHIEELHVLSFNENHLILDLRSKDELKKMFDNIDSHVVSIIQERKITKKLKTKFNYRQFTSTYTNKDNNYDILSFNVNFNNDVNYITEIYENKHNKVTFDNASLLLKNNARAEVVLELVSIVFDKADGHIYLENIVRQMKIKKIKPKRIDRIAYSFVDSESEISDEEDNQSKDSQENEETEDEETEENKNYLSSDSEDGNYNTRTDDDRLLNNLHNLNIETDDICVEDDEGTSDDD
jgi:hypothetical protein